MESLIAALVQKTRKLPGSIKHIIMDIVNGKFCLSYQIFKAIFRG